MRDRTLRISMRHETWLRWRVDGAACWLRLGVAQAPKAGHAGEDGRCCSQVVIDGKVKAGEKF